MAKMETALIIGAGPGLSASLARVFSAEGMQIALAARNLEKLAEIAGEIKARCYACDAGVRNDVEALFQNVNSDLGAPDVVVYNPSRRIRGPLIELDPEEVDKALRVTCYGGFLVAQCAARLMLQAGGGSILFTGASASIKGYPRSAPFAMGKFGLRGLAQSMARELAPGNIHVAHFVIDGGIRGPGHPAEGNDAQLDPAAIARSYLYVHRQHRSAWTWEMELRPWVEKF